MWQYLKNLFALAFSPSEGWEEVSYSCGSPKELARKGFLPLMAVGALTCFVELFYRHVDIFPLIVRTIAVFGGFVVSFFICNILMESILPGMISGKPNKVKIETVGLYVIGLLMLCRIVENCLPTDFTFLKFLPIFVGLVVYRAVKYLSVRSDKEVMFLLIGFAVWVVLPESIVALLECMENI